MTFIKNLILGIFGLAILLFVISIFLPAKVHVQRTVEVNAKPEVVFNIVNDIKTYDNWMPWNKIDPSMKITYEGPESGKGASYSWVSSNSQVGKGTYTIVSSKPNEYVKTFMDFKENGTGHGEFLLEEQKDGTEVTWSMDTEFKGNILKAAIGKYMGLFMDKMVGPSFEQGLNDIKRIAESTPKPIEEPAKLAKQPLIKIEVRSTKPLTVITIQSLQAKTYDEVGQKLGESYAQVMAIMHKEGLQENGKPVAWYQTQVAPFTFDAGIPVDKKPTVLPQGVVERQIRGGQSVIAHFYGPYEMTPKGYTALLTWLKTNKKEVAGKPYEVYVTDPTSEKDPYKWQTDIIMPIR